ncbi:MAG: cytochrome P450 [Myxococcota bacterium]
MELIYEPFSPEIRVDPYPTYARLRAEAPIYRAREADAWVLSRYEDVRFLLSHDELFSSDAMGAALAGRAPRAVQGAGTPRIVILLDPPQHGPMRSLLNRGFTPRRVSQIEIRLREIVAETMAHLKRRTRIDIVSELAVPVPTTIIAELLGVERERMSDFKRWSCDIIAGSTGSTRPTSVDALPNPVFLRSIGELSEYLGELGEARLLSPRDDLLTQLVRAQHGHVALTHDEVVMFALVLLIAGNETTTNLIGNVVHTLLAHPEQLERVQRDRSLIAGVIEETLRYEAPIQFVFRRARSSIERHGVTIREGETVIGLIGAANRDERHFPDPERFDITRDTSGHLTFGFGIHFCLGASLARLEAQLTLEALLEELPNRRLVTTVVENVDSFLVRGPRELVLENAA